MRNFQMKSLADDLPNHSMYIREIIVIQLQNIFYFRFWEDNIEKKRIE